TTTTLTATAKEAYMADLTAYAEGSASRSVAIQPVAQVPNYPDVSLKNETLTVGEQSKGVLTLEKGAGVAAADFTLTYDPAKLSCLGVAKHPSLSEAGGMIVINPNYQNGTIRFSYLNESDYEGDISLIEITWQPLDGSSHAVITPSATGVYDLNYKKVTLEYIATDDCVYVPNVTPPTCLEGGFTTYTCSCGKSFTDHPTEATGHSYTAVVTPPTCLERGFTTHTCRCGDSYVDSWVDSLGGTHILQDHEGKLPTCTEIGWQPYQTCSRCEYTTYTKIPATGHSHIASVTPPTCLEGGYTTFTCHCGDSYVGDRVAATGHTMGDWTETKIPTCTEYGSRRRDCISCDHYETEQLDYRHSFGPWMPSGDLEYRTCSLCFYTETRQNEYAPDCETITLTPLYGVVENLSGKTWFIVGVGSSSNQTLFDALRSKSYTLKVTVTDETAQKTSVISQYLFNDPNSEFYGDSFLRIAVCEYCIVPVLGHAYTVQFDVYDGQTIIYTGSSDTGAFNTFNADFTANGPILADHSYGDWFETVAPSCTIGGTKQRNCIYCDHFETDLIPATGHDHKAVVTVPTCTDEGYTTHTCHCGDTYVDSYLPETGHTDADHDLHCDGCGTMLAETGDINGDGTVDMKDAAMLQRHVLKIDILTDDGVLACADVTGDGIVDMKDAAKLTRYVIKVIDSLN
ncbi:MAG: hypothetical protein E7599_07470, partial [Ruminococcaceae bacterium]|nr:hypothetical protein [Oscillospiraceae bacterium]